MQLSGLGSGCLAPAVSPNTALHLTAYSLCFAALRFGFRQQVSLGVSATSEACRFFQGESP